MSDGEHRSGAGAERALDALLGLCPLDALPRTGWLLRGVRPAESIAGHIVGVAHVALALAPRVEPALDLGRVLAIALVHDAPEAASGDLPRPAAEHLPPGAKRSMEDALARELVTPLSEEAAAAWRDCAEGASREARFVKACDVLQLGVRLLALERAGHGGLDEFWEHLAAAGLSEFPPAEALRAAIEGRR
ncbi:MAG: HD domain-containing protein [Planctomycetota bacterium]|nr:HD domain-containing protein [Planctomycetota bacterium]MEC8512714.1 HD domain-containing protein [Planctomycetota bacterium]